MNHDKFKNGVIIAVITSMLSMESIDANILNIAIPTMATKLMVSPIHLKQAITSYLVAFAIFIPICGWISDRFGTKRTLLVSITGFCLASFLCGVSHNLYSLSLFRFFQGVNAAFMVPVARILLLKAFPKEKLVKIYLIMSIPTIVGPLMAPLIGGLIITHYTWPFIFFVNLPIGFLAFIATYFYINNYKQNSEIFSLMAYFLLALALALLILFLNTATATDVSFNFKISILLAMLIFIGLYLYFEKSAKTKVIQYSLFTVKTFRICFINNFIIRCAFGGRGFMLALYLQIALHIKPQNAGYLLASTTIGLLISRLFLQKILVIYGFKRILRISNYGSAISLMVIPTIHHINVFTVIILILNGLFISVTFMLMNILCYADVKDKDHANAVSLNLTIQQIALAVGVLIASYCLEFFNFLFKHNLSHKIFSFSFFILALISLIAEYYFLQLNINDGQHMMQKPKNSS